MYSIQVEGELPLLMCLHIFIYIHYFLISHCDLITIMCGWIINQATRKWGTIPYFRSVRIC